MKRKREITADDVKIVSTEEAMWTEWRERAEETIVALKKEIKLNEAIMEICDERINTERVKGN